MLAAAVRKSSQLDLTADGLKVLSCCKDGSIGVLDMNTQVYEVIHRSHAAMHH